MTPTRIDWVAEHCQLLRSISAEFKATLPFRGLTIGTGIHLEAKTVALLLTLRDGGARLVGMLLTGIAVRMAAREYAPSAASAYIEAK